MTFHNQSSEEMDSVLETGEVQMNLLAEFQNLFGKAVECISVLCIVPFEQGLVDDIISCESSVSVCSKCTHQKSSFNPTNLFYHSIGSVCRSSPGQSCLGWCGFWSHVLCIDCLVRFCTRFSCFQRPCHGQFPLSGIKRWEKMDFAAGCIQRKGHCHILWLEPDTSK